MKCKKIVMSTTFEINYKKELVKFKEKIFGKKKMGLKEFAITILQIEPIEVIAMYVGKLGFDVYNSKGKFRIMVNKKMKNGIKGIIGYNEN